MSVGGFSRVVTGAAIALIVIGLGLLVLPFAEPAPDPVRIEGASAVAGGARVDLRVSRRGRLSVEIRTTGGELVRVLRPEAAISPGTLSLEWDRRRHSGVDAPPGAYVIRATAYPGLRPFVVERQMRVGA